MRGAGLGISLAVSLAATARVARPNEPEPQAPASRAVEVVIAGSEEDAQALERSLGELLRRLGLTLRATRVERLDPQASGPLPEAGVVVRVAIDLHSQGGALVVMSDPRTNRSSMRRVVGQDSQAVLLEEVAHVVQAGTESLLAGESPPPETHEDAGAPVAAPPPPPRPIARIAAHDAEALPPRAEAGQWNLDGVAVASGESFASGYGIVFGVGAGARFDLGREALRPALWLVGEYHLPFGNTGLPVELHASVWSARVLPTLQLIATPRFLLEAGAGCGFDVFALSPGAVVAGTQQSASRTDVSAILSGLVVGHLSFSPSANVFLAATLDWDLTPREYLVASGPLRTALIAPLGVRPGISAGFAFDVAGVGGAR